MICANIPKAIEPLKVINSQDQGSYAVLTCLGWIINGPLVSTAPVDEYSQAHIPANHIFVAGLEELLVKQYIQDFSELVLIMKKEGDYEIKLPFHQDNKEH